MEQATGLSKDSIHLERVKMVPGVLLVNDNPTIAANQTETNQSSDIHAQLLPMYIH